MGGEKHQYEPLPIPTYEEAVASSSRSPSVAPSPLSPAAARHDHDVHQDEERQALLSRNSGHASQDRHSDEYQPQPVASRSSYYCPPTVESARSSTEMHAPPGLDDSDALLERASTDALRREVQEMELDDRPSASQNPSRLSRTYRSVRKRLGTLRLPLLGRLQLPRIDFSARLTSSPCYQTGLDIEGQKCMIFLRLFALLLVLAVVYAIFISDVFSFRKMNLGQIFDPESVRIFAESKVNETFIRDNLDLVTRYPHVAGTEGSYALAQLVQARFEDSLMDTVKLERFDVYLNYPRQDGRRVAIVEPAHLAWQADLDEGPAYKDREQTLAFHGHSKSGNVTGPLVYANYGSRSDFAQLKELGVQVQGSVVIVRYYGTQTDRALKVKAAELAGAIGCIIYSDPAEDGFRRGPVYPDGRYRPLDSVQRGAVSLMSWVVGDVLSPGWASTPEEKARLSPEESHGLVNIPSLPLSAKDAQQLMSALRGFGHKVPNSWIGGLADLDEWWTGSDGDQVPRVNLVNLQEEVERQPIYNVIAQVNGMEEPEQKVIIGAHRDAWCFGAVDPGSGTAVLLEVARVLGELRAAGWRPLRSVQIASWDGEEYNLIGSTEHVEKHLKDLRQDGIVYINVDAAVSGRSLQVQANPVFKEAVLRTLDRLTDPGTGQNLRQTWENQSGGVFKGLGAGSDYVAFQDIAGVSSIDLSFAGEPYPYHSCYDNFAWMSQFGDPGFHYHKLLAQIWVLLILEFSDNPVLPLDMPAYAAAISGYIADLEKYGKDAGAHRLVYDSLRSAAEAFEKAAKKTAGASHNYADSLDQTGGFETSLMAARRRGHNSLLAMFDKRLLDLEEGGGLFNRTQYKHLIFGPQAWSGYEEAYFPAIRDAIDAGNVTLSQECIEKVAQVLRDASRRL
ncbi:hypothetical protein KEM52_006577 [Ascosphaera acerosa]|nr:hypothetical protein KEM52_006577 [Ascosphaera acerosa]